MNDILCSILIPVYNGEKFLEKTIQSCLAQTIADKIEIIAIDDCSSDSSLEILEKFALLNQNVIAKRNEENMGIIKTLNKAASMAKGKYLMFLGHDDMLYPNHIEQIIKEFDDKTSFVHCNADLIDKDDKIFGVAVDDAKQLKKTKNIKYYLALGNVVHSTGAIIQKSFFDKVGGWDESYRNYGEWLLWIKLSSIGNVRYSTKVKALYRRHDTNITNSFEDKNVKPELLKFYEDCRKTAIENIDIVLVKKYLEIKQYIKPKIKRLLMLINRIINKLKRISIVDTFSVILNKKLVLFWSHGEETDKNFGDAINPLLFEKLTQRRVADSSKIINFFGKPTFYFIGSILDNLNKNNAIICGAGFQNENAKILKKPSKIIAVRGPLTRDNFIKQGVECPEIYCDPAMLLPNVYMPKKIEKKYKVGIVPHYVDKDKCSKVEIISLGLNYCFIDIEDNWINIIDQINSCEYILSSSLHGIIVAHAYKVPATRMILSDKIVGGDFKFDDYALSVSDKLLEKYIVNNSIDLNKAIELACLYDTSKASSKFQVAMKDLEMK